MHCFVGLPLSVQDYRGKKYDTCLFFFLSWPILLLLAGRYLHRFLIDHRICTLVFCILCNLKINDTASLSWTIVFIPIFGLLILWIFIFIYVLSMSALNVFILKKQQMDSVILYLVASIGTFASLVIFVSLETSDESTVNTYALIATSILLVSEILFFIGIVKSADATIALVIDRMGSDRPQNLVRSEEGWEIDTTMSFEHYPFVGEIETTRSISNNEERVLLPFCGCCVNLAVGDLLCSREAVPCREEGSQSGSRNEFESLA